MVAVKRVPDPEARARPDGEPAVMGMNPYDAAALALALRLRQSGAARELIAVSCGSGDCRETLRAAVAAGADRAVLLETRAMLQPLAVARLLKSFALEEAADLVLLGRQASDDDAAQTGPMLAAMLGWPQATSVSELRILDASLRATRVVDGGAEVLALDLPAVVTTDPCLNGGRFAFGAHATRSAGRGVEVRPAETLGVDLEPRLQILRAEAPPSRRLRIRVANVEELLLRLQDAGALE